MGAKTDFFPILKSMYHTIKKLTLKKKWSLGKPKNKKTETNKIPLAILDCFTPL